MNEKIFHLRTRTVRALYLIAGSFTLLLVGFGFFVLMSGDAFFSTVAGHDLPLR